MNQTLFNYGDWNGSQPNDNSLKFEEKVLREENITYSEFNEEYHAFKNHTAMINVKIILKRAMIDKSIIPSGRKTAKKIQVPGYLIRIYHTALNLKDEINQDEFKDICYEEDEFEDEKMIAEKMEFWIESTKSWIEQVSLTIPASFICQLCDVTGLPENVNTGRYCVREKYSNLGPYTNEKGESDFMCPQCPEIFKTKCNKEVR